MIKNTLAIAGLATALIFSAPSFSATDFLNSENCVGSLWTDASGNTISMDDKFGPGAQAVTRCLGETKDAKVVYQINTLHKDANQNAPYAVGNILNHIVDFEKTHGMTSENYEIVVVVHSSGWPLVLNGAANPYASAMTDLVSRDGVKVLFCQNTAAKKNVKLADMIPGIGFTTSGVSALSDLQEAGYRYVQP